MVWDVVNIVSLLPQINFPIKFSVIEGMRERNEFHHCRIYTCVEEDPAVGDKENMPLTTRTSQALSYLEHKVTYHLPWSRHLDDRAAQKAAPWFDCCFTLEKLWRGWKIVARLLKTRDHQGGDSTVNIGYTILVLMCQANRASQLFGCDPCTVICSCSSKHCITEWPTINMIHLFVTWYNHFLAVLVQSIFYSFNLDRLVFKKYPLKSAP